MQDPIHRIRGAKPLKSIVSVVQTCTITTVPYRLTLIDTYPSKPNMKQATWDHLMIVNIIFEAVRAKSAPRRAKDDGSSKSLRLDIALRPANRLKVLQ